MTYRLGIIRRASSIRWAFATCALFCLFPAQGGAIQIQGTRVLLSAPDEFKPSLHFPGVRHEKLTAAIVVNEIPSSYINFSRQYNDASLDKTGMELISRENIESDGLSGQLLLVKQLQRGIRYERWILITGDTNESVMIAGYYPVKNRRSLRGPIEKALRSALWDSARDLDHFDGLGFRIDDVPSLRIVTRMSNSLVFTETGRMPDLYYTDALLMMSLKPVPEGAKLNERFAQDQFMKITLLENHNLTLTQSKSVAGIRGVVIEGTGRHRHLGYEVAVMQIILETDSGFFVAQGFTKLDDMENDFDVFRATISSFRLEKPKEPF